MEFGYWDENFKEWPIFYENGITNNPDVSPENYLYYLDLKEKMFGM